MDTMPENAPQDPQAAADEPAARTPPAAEETAAAAPHAPAEAVFAEPDPRAPFLHETAQVRDRALLAIRQHDLPALGHAVHALADVVHRMIRGPVGGK